MQARTARKTVVVLACAIAVLASPAHTLASEPPPWLICAGSEIADEAAAHAMPLEPADGATVPAGTPITLSAETNTVLMFSVASSQALLSSPDIDSGTGSQSGVFYRFTSTKATATPRTIYWTASFTLTLHDCESPSTFTTPVHTLVVVPSEAELGAAKKRQDEATAKKKLEEETAAKEREEAAAAAGSVVLDGLTVEVRSSQNEALVKLTCSDVATCTGKLRLTVTTTAGKGRARHAKTEGIGQASFSITAGEEATIKLALDKTGRALLMAAHGHLDAILTIARTAPLPNKTQTQRVLVEQHPAARQKGSLPDSARGTSAIWRASLGT
jgi:hypothetical protein